MRVFWLAYGEYRGKRTVKHFMRYVRARLEEYQQTLAYRIYISDSLFCAGDNKRLVSRFYDVITKPKDTRTADEIATDIINRLGIKVR